MLCNKCAANLPDESQFCLKCGEPVTASAISTAPLITVVGSVCSGCGAELPEGAEFCQKCGWRVSFPAKIAAASQGLPRRRDGKPRLALWSLLVALIGLTVWAATSDNPSAQQFQEFVGWKRDQTILDTPFTVNPHTFQYYKFSLPEGSVNVAVVGEFTATSNGGNSGNRKDKDKDKDRSKHGNKDKDQDQGNDSNIEVYVLTDSAFAIWQNGYATGALYESGRVAEGTVHADVPAGAGVYYLVFSNKFAPKTMKAVRATVLLRYRSWLPELIRRTKARAWNWIDL